MFQFAAHVQLGKFSKFSESLASFLPLLIPFQHFVKHCHITIMPEIKLILAQTNVNIIIFSGFISSFSGFMQVNEIYLHKFTLIFNVNFNAVCFII